MRPIAMVLAAISGSFFALPAAANDWRTLTGAEIATALTGRTLIYDTGASQHFHASGRTLYNAGADSWGYWSVRTDQYCSQWPPNTLWSCYDLARKDEDFRFTDSFGNHSQGRLHPLNQN